MEMDLRQFFFQPLSGFFHERRVESAFDLEGKGSAACFFDFGEKSRHL